MNFRPRRENARDGYQLHTVKVSEGANDS